MRKIADPIFNVLIGILTLAILSSLACTKVDVIVSGGKQFGPLHCDPKHLSLGMIGKKQEKDTWCWATSSQSILEYYGYGTFEQCDLITQARAEGIEQDNQNLPPGLFTGCCEEPPITSTGTGGTNLDSVAARVAYGNECLSGGLPDEVFAYYNMRYRRTAIHTALKWIALQHELCDFGPFIFMVEWLGGGSHTGMVDGYHVTNVPGYERWVELDDHAHSGFFLKPYDEFVDDPTEHRHYRDYINFRPGF